LWYIDLRMKKLIEGVKGDIDTEGEELDRALD